LSRRAALEKRIAHRFTAPRLLEQALTHRSLGADNNERLEFLGDAVLGLLIAEELYRRFPDADEGDLSRLRSRLVNTRISVQSETTVAAPATCTMRMMARL